jgi:hypothetical protein
MDYSEYSAEPSAVAAAEKVAAPTSVTKRRRK